jgi:pyruvate dehydrogenase E2 component (dihydrolipoamide acetyltransferase)
VKEVVMPKLAMTQETGTILQWYKAEGDTVETGEPILEVMTNKINIDVESYHDGILLKHLYEEGAEVPVLEAIAYISDEEDEKDEIHAQVRATPAARVLARAQGINLQNVPGSGNLGRIHKEDVQALIEKRDSSVVTPPSERKNGKRLSSQTSLPDDTPLINNDSVTNNEQLTNNGLATNNSQLTKQKAKTGSLLPGDTIVNLSGTRRIIGARMAESALQSPHVTLMLEIDMLLSTELRKQLMPLVEEQTGIRLSLNTIILKAAANVLRTHPNVNATWGAENELVYHKAVNLAMAVAVPGGLVAPVIHDADRKGYCELSVSTKQLSELARTQKLPLAAFENGTFTVSNLGMYGIEQFTPIINPPQVAILGVGAVIEKPVAVNGSVEVRPRMALSLSFDHRALDGAEAANFLKDLKQVLELPMLALA